ncbi:MAG: AsmA-like C-terminal region-containing protein [bacterium]
MKKILKISAITFGVILFLLLALLLTPLLFKDKVAEVLKNTANKSLRTEVNFSGMELSFFRHFPNLTVTLSDLTLKASAPFTGDTLIAARDISFGINLKSLIKGPIEITRVYINKGKIILQYNEKGASSFDIFPPSSSDTASTDTTTGIAKFQVESIAFIKTDFIYSDPSIPLKVVAHGINYHGKSLLTNDILRLTSRVQIDSLDCIYNRVAFIRSKPVRANLSTRINLNSFEMKFDKNDFYIRDVPFEFRGEFSFRKKGYDLFLSLFSMLGEEYISGSVRLISEENLWLFVKTDINLNLEPWSKALGVSDVELRGLFSMKLNAEGEFRTGQNPDSREPDTIPLSIPNFTLNSKLVNGYFHYKKLPEALTGISFVLDLSTTGNDYNNLKIQLEDLKAGFMKNKIEGFFRLDGFRDLPIEANLFTTVNLEELRRVIPLDSIDLKGMLELNLFAKGKYAPEKKLFPETRLSLNMTGGSILTKYYSRPVEKIEVSATVTNNTGKVDDTKVSIAKAGFSFENNPFELRGEIANPENLRYDLTSKGSIDLARIYKLFAMTGMDLKGYIGTDLALKGRQSDALAGRIEKLHNMGKLVLRDIDFTSEFLPKPLVLKSGIFRFENDKIWFEKFKARYGASDITLDGYLSNIVNYLLAKEQPLKGSLTFKSDYLLVDEFESPAGAGTTVVSEETAGPSGVIVIPKELEVALNAKMKRVSFRKLELKDLAARVEVKKGMLLLKDMNFEAAGCKVGMEATYTSITPVKAFFDFTVKAQDFDVKRAYNEVELFRKLSTVAGKCEGIISLDYALKGQIGPGMGPIYPSLEGGGVVTLKKVKVMGYKMLNAMGSNLGKEKIKNPELTKVELKTTIKNNIITLEKVKIKMSGFRLRIAGETSFDGGLNFKARLGLPPLGIIGIPMRILGTQENPKFKYGHGNQDEDLDESVYTDEIPQEMMDKIKNAKEEDLKEDPDQQ